MTLSYREVDPESTEGWEQTQPKRFRKLAKAAGLEVTSHATISIEEAVTYLTTTKTHQMGDIRTPEREQENLYLTAVRRDAEGRERDAVQVGWSDGKLSIALVGGHKLGPVKFHDKISAVYDALKALEEFAHA